MNLTAHQPVYLPWLGLFHKIALSDTFCYFDGVQYLKKEWHNRNKIKAQGKEVMLTVPVLATDHREKDSREIKIDNSRNWKKKHWKTIYLNYKKTPYFNRYIDFFENVYKKDWQYLNDLNEYMLKWFLRQLGIKVDFHKASELNFQGHKSDLVLNMCKKLGADLYIFGALGKDYAEEEKFKEENVNIYFQNYNHPTYPQLGKGEFISHLSIIDLLFNCGDKSLEFLMEGNITKEDLIKKFIK